MISLPISVTTGSLHHRLAGMKYVDTDLYQSFPLSASGTCVLPVLFQYISSNYQTVSFIISNQLSKLDNSEVNIK